MSRTPVYSAPFCKENVLSSGPVLATFVKDCLAIETWVNNFLELNSIPLVHVSTFMSIPCSVGYSDCCVILKCLHSCSANWDGFDNLSSVLFFYFFIWFRIVFVYFCEICHWYFGGWMYWIFRFSLDTHTHTHTHSCTHTHINTNTYTHIYTHHTHASSSHSNQRKPSDPL